MTSILSLCRSSSVFIAIVSRPDSHAKSVFSFPSCASSMEFLGNFLAHRLINACLIADIRLYFYSVVSAELVQQSVGDDNFLHLVTLSHFGLKSATVWWKRSSGGVRTAFRAAHWRVHICCSRNSHWQLLGTCLFFLLLHGSVYYWQHLYDWVFLLLLKEAAAPLLAFFAGRGETVDKLSHQEELMRPSWPRWLLFGNRLLNQITLLYHEVRGLSCACLRFLGSNSVARRRRWAIDCWQKLLRTHMPLFLLLLWPRCCTGRGVIFLVRRVAFFRLLLQGQHSLPSPRA